MKHKILKIVTFLLLLAVWYPSNAQQWENIWHEGNCRGVIITNFHTPDTGWAICFRNLYYTTNGGETFQNVYQMPDSLIFEPEPTCQPTRIYPVSGTTAYLKFMRMMGDKIYKTTDGGLTFAEWETLPTTEYHPRIYISEDTVVAYRSSTSSIVYSLDGGLSWTPADGASNLTRGFNCFHKTKKGRLWAFGKANNDFFYSDNNGLSWQTKPSPIDNSSYIKQVSFLDEEKAIMITRDKVNMQYEYYLYVTDDAFNTIKYFHSLVDFLDCRTTVEICYQKEDAIWMTHPSNIYISRDGGESFNVYQELNCFYIHHLHFRDNVGYVGVEAPSYKDLILKYVDTTTSIMHTAITNNTLSVFPNPVSQELSVTFPYSAIGELQISIISIEGKTIFSSEIAAKTSNSAITIPVHSLSTGVYFLNVVGNNYSETTKFIINR
ncbi:MAG TPA: T9SS type A sorting domain-containing protein [Salinivirgaceae bacterium]|nr:T9SS type A sorting domain-containing protein [Salinivirgaceae bacterium]